MRCLHGLCHIFYSRCCGWCSLPLHHQMAWQWPKGQQIAWWVLCHYKRKEESPYCTLLRFGDSFYVHMELSYLFAYRHYSICKNFFQYAFGNLKLILIRYQSNPDDFLPDVSNWDTVIFSLLYPIAFLFVVLSDAGFRSFRKYSPLHLSYLLYTASGYVILNIEKGKP